MFLKSFQCQPLLSISGTKVMLNICSDGVGGSTVSIQNVKDMVQRVDKDYLKSLRLQVTFQKVL